MKISNEDELMEEMKSRFDWKVNGEIKQIADENEMIEAKS
jgi:hypothetical protein